MKIRHGFVSNSSSSSFVVAVEDAEHAEVRITLRLDISRYADVFIRTKEELDKHYLDYHGWNGKPTLEEIFAEDPYGEEVKKEYDKSLDAIRRGKLVMVGGFTNENGDPGEYFLAEHGIPKNAEGIEIIHNEAGF